MTNLKPVLSYIEVSKTCTELYRSIENRKSLGNSTDRAGEGR
jgi:hypothetical protein